MVLHALTADENNVGTHKQQQHYAGYLNEAKHKEAGHFRTGSPDQANDREDRPGDNIKPQQSDCTDHQQ